MYLWALIALLSVSVGAADSAFAQATPAPEIRVGQTKPYSGPASAYGVQGKAEAAYIQMINDRGGVNGRRINLISLDDGYSPPKTVEQTRRLVEQDGVALLFATLGTPTNIAIRKYLNDRKIPQLFIQAGASTFADPARYPWTIPGILSYYEEGRLYAQDVLKSTPDAKIGILYANDDGGRDYADGFKAGLGQHVGQIVRELKYETSDPTVDSQMVSLASSGATVFFFHATPKFGAQILRKKRELAWGAKTYVAATASSVAAVFVPAGLDAAQGVISGVYLKDVADPQWGTDPGRNAYVAWMEKYFPGANLSDNLYVSGYTGAQVLVRLLEKCGDDLSRENIMEQARRLDLELPMLLPGVRFTTSPDNYQPIRTIRLQVFKGDRWVLIDQ